MHGGPARLVLSVHDELLFEVNLRQLELLNDGMSVGEAFQIGKGGIELTPKWAGDLPIDGEGAVLDRYGKP